MNALEGCVDFTDLFFYGCQVDASRLLLGLSLVCEQKAGEYLIADLLTRPVFQAVFSQWGS